MKKRYYVDFGYCKNYDILHEEWQEHISYESAEEFETLEEAKCYFDDSLVESNEYVALYEEEDEEQTELFYKEGKPEIN